MIEMGMQHLFFRKTLKQPRVLPVAHAKITK